MGRFFKTARPTFVDDVIYQAPHELMLGALQSQDINFDNQQKKLDAFDTMGDLLDFTDKDKDARNAALDAHRNKAADLAEKIQKNPALYQSYIGEINRAKKEFNNDIKSGTLFEADRNAKRRTKARADLKSRFDKGLITEDAFNTAQETMDREYQGVGKGDYAESIHVYDKIDESKFQKDLKSTINLDTTATSTTVPKRGYLITDGETKTYLSDERIKEIIDTDPTMDKWKREQLQTLDRQLQNGKFASETEMQAEYTRRLENFRQNTIDKLGFQKITNVDDVKTDSAYWQKKRLGLDWTKFNHQKKKEEANLNSYKVEMAGNYENLSDDKINNIYGDPATTRASGPVQLNGVPPTRNLTTAEKRKRLETEKKNLTGKLTQLGITQKDFRDKMMTHEGRIQLAEKLGMSKKVLARQANYDKTYSFNTITSPLENGKDVIENTKYLRTVNNTFNNLAPNEKVTIKIVDSEGNVENESNISLGEAFEKGFVQGQTSAKNERDLVWDGELNGYAAGDGGIVRMPNPNYNPDDEDSEELIPATKNYALASGKAKSKLIKTEKFDASKPLLHIKPNQLSQSKKRNFGDGTTKATEKQVYNIHTSKMIDGKLKTIIISKELNIDSLK